MVDGTDAAIAEAEGTSQESSTETETSTAQGTEQETSGDAQAGKGETSQETASTDESKDEDPKPDKDNRVTIHAEHFQRLKQQRSDAKATLKEFKELGIESKEHAEFLRRGADDFAFVIDQIENKPEEFFRGFRQQYPQQYESHAEQIGRKHTAEFLANYVKPFRQRGEEGDAKFADFLEELTETAFVVWADKSTSNDIERAICQLLDTNIPQLARKLHDELERVAGSYLWGFLEEKWEQLNTPSSLDIAVLERMIRHRAAIQIGDIGNY